MPRYIVNQNPQSTGEHEVHRDDGTCPKPPNPENRVELGYFAYCSDALRAARLKWPKHKFDGCYYCANACHTG